MRTLTEIKADLESGYVRTTKSGSKYIDDKTAFADLRLVIGMYEGAMQAAAAFASGEPRK